MTLMAGAALRRDRLGMGLLAVILAGLFLVQVPPMVLQPAPERVAQAMIWLFASVACALMVHQSPNGGKSMAPVYLAVIVPCMGLGWFLQYAGFHHGPGNPGVIASHVFGTLAILDAGDAGITRRVGRLVRRLDGGSGRGNRSAPAYLAGRAQAKVAAHGRE